MSQKEVNAAYKFDVNIFKERFYKLRKSLNYSQAEFAAFLEIPTGSVGGYENGDKTPNSATLFKIAKKCNVSTDYLLGISNIKSTDTELKAVCNYTGLSEKSIEKIASWAKGYGYYYCYYGPRCTFTNRMKTKELDKLISCADFDNLIEHVVMYRSELRNIEEDIFNVTNNKIELDVGVFDSLDEINNRFRAARCDYYDCLHKFESCIKEQTQKDYNRVDELLKDAFRSYGFNEDENGDDAVNGEHN